ncbi:SPOR domain-containing protein [Tsuneonella sp. HG094]
MRLPVDAGFRFLALGLTTAALAACGVIGGGDRPATSLGANGSLARDITGPAADYPVILGEVFTVDGTQYTPADTMNYDVVGYAGRDAGEGVTIAHRTLPLPSYVEITSLGTGKTILARVERRGPMAGSQFVALSAGAASQLGAEEGAAVRVRRVNPLEKDRAELRAGRSVPDRMDTPKALVDVLRRKLPTSGAASLKPQVPANQVGELASVAPKAEPARAVVVAPKAGSAYPLPPLATKQIAAPTPIPAKDVGVAVSPAIGDFVIQAGTFASQDNAKRAAQALGGHVTPAGKLYRVRTGPFTSRGQADAALAKVRAAGYSDARVTTAG